MWIISSDEERDVSYLVFELFGEFELDSEAVVLFV